MNAPRLGRLDAPVVRILTALRRQIFRAADMLPLVANAYYAVLSTRFHGEQRTVAAGISRHLSSNPGLPLQYRMRRGIHRLEKGISMRDRRAVFGLAYIEQTVEDYRRLCSANPGQSLAEELKWYESVLDTYFQICTSDDNRYLRARSAYSRSENEKQDSARRSPYPASARPPLPFGIDEFELLARRRRSVRWFLPEPVDGLALRRAVEVANQSPSACNRQSVRFMLFEEAADARRLGSLAPGASGMWTNFTALAVLVADFSAYAHERDRHAVYVDGGLKAMTFMYALESLGLASCPLNWPDNSKLDRRIASELRLQSFERVVLMIAVGYADPSGLVPFSHKVAADNS